MISTAPLAPITAICGGRPGVVDVAAQVLRRHDVIGAAIGLAGDDRDLRHRRLGIGEEQLGAVLDEAAIFLRRARQEARHVDEGDDRDVEAVAEAHEARRLAEASESSTPASTIGWLATKPTVRPSMRPKPVTMFLAKASWISKKSPSSATFRISSLMS